MYGKVNKYKRVGVTGMKEYREIVGNSKGSVDIKDLDGYKVIGKGSDGTVFLLTSDRCIKVFYHTQTKALELKALQVGQSSPILPRIYEDGPNYLIMEYI